MSLIEDFEMEEVVKSYMVKWPSQRENKVNKQITVK